MNNSIWLVVVTDCFSHDTFYYYLSIKHGHISKFRAGLRFKLTTPDDRRGLVTVIPAKLMKISPQGICDNSKKD